MDFMARANIIRNCFGVVFGISTQVYANIASPALWDFPVPIAGHFGVLILSVVLINWGLCTMLQTYDILNGLIPPIQPNALPWWPDPHSLGGLIQLI
jgi:hypothetical protein